jgi:hypothetical protein
MTSYPLPAPVRVLYISDDPRADETASLLAYFGCDVRHRRDGPAGLSAAVGFDPHVCLLDLSARGAARVGHGLRRQAGGRPVLMACLVRGGRRGAGDLFHVCLPAPADPLDLLAVARGVAAALAARPAAATPGR